MPDGLFTQGTVADGYIEIEGEGPTKGVDMALTYAWEMLAIALPEATKAERKELMNQAYEQVKQMVTELQVGQSAQLRQAHRTL